MENELFKQFLVAAQARDVETVSRYILNNPKILLFKDEFENMPLHVYLSSQIIDYNVLTTIVQGCPSAIKTAGKELCIIDEMFKEMCKIFN